jgi:hypothetical protein
MGEKKLYISGEKNFFLGMRIRRKLLPPFRIPQNKQKALQKEVGVGGRGAGWGGVDLDKSLPLSKLQIVFWKIEMTKRETLEG